MCQPYSGWAFSGLLRDVGQKRPSSLKFVTYIYNDEFGTVTPYVKKIQIIYKLRNAHLGFCWHQHFLLEIDNFYYIKQYRYRLHFNAQFLILLTFSEPLKFVSINIIAILMTSAKLATLGYLKTKVFWMKGYDVITFVHDFTNKIFSYESSLYCRCGHVNKVW